MNNITQLEIPTHIQQECDELTSLRDAPALITKLWHYTIWNYLPSILESGIKVATANVPTNEKPVVWLSKNQFWEETANKSYKNNGKIYKGDMEDTRKLGGGLVRINVSRKISPITWNEFVEKKHIQKRHAWLLINAAKKDGANPDDWYVSFEGVETEDFLCIEYLNDENEWVDISTM